MSTANLVPETWELTGDDAQADAAPASGRRRLIADAFRRLRSSDGFSHARSLAFLGILLFVEVVIAAIGISDGLGQRPFSKAISESLQSVAARTGGQRARGTPPDQAHQAASSGHWLAIVFGTDRRADHGDDGDGADRAGDEPHLRHRDGPADTCSKYRPRLPRRLTGGRPDAPRPRRPGTGGTLARAFQSGGALTSLEHRALAARRRSSDRGARTDPQAGRRAGTSRPGPGCRSPPSSPSRCWSWSRSCSTSSSLSAVRSATPTARWPGSSRWRSGPTRTSIALLFGAALAAQLEAVRAGAAAPRSVGEDRRFGAGLRCAAGRSAMRPSEEAVMATPAAREPRSCEQRITAMRRTLEGVMGIPATEGNAIDVLRNGDEIFPAMLESIAAARKTDRLPDLRVLEGRDRQEVRGGAVRARRGRRARARAARRLGRAVHRAGARST